MKKSLLSMVALLGMSSVAMAGVGTKNDPYTVDDLLGMEIPAEPEVGVYVKAYIVGYVPTQYWSDVVFGNENCETKSNIVIASTAQEDDAQYAMPVAIPAGSLRDVLSIAANPNVLGHEVVLCGTWTKYFGVSGIKDVTSYEWVGTAPVGPVVSGETGSASAPLTVSQFLAMGTPAAAIPNTYLTGVIVGYVPGMNYSEGVFSASGEVSKTNILLAESASETNLDNCVPIQLPTGVRSALNLADNAGNLGKTVTLLGSHEAYFGVNGLKSVSAYSFGSTLEGGDTPTPGGETGSKEAPLSVAEYLALGTPAAAVPNTWVKGYIVGYVNGMNLTAAVFGLPAADENQTNILIAGSANESSVDNCIPVQLPAGEVRSALNLWANNDNLGKVVTLCGNREKYFGVCGMKSTSEYYFDGEVAPEAIYIGLVSNMDDWTILNEVMPSELDYIWTWNASYGAVASAYKDGQAYASEAYLITPVIDLTEVVGANVKFDHAAKFQTSLTELCGLVVREAGTESWTALTVPTWPTAGSWSFANTGDIALTDWEGKKIELALKYESTSSASDTWEVKNFKVTGTDNSGVETILIGEETVYAVAGTIVAPEGSKVFNLNGVATGITNLPNGLYIVVTPRGAKKVMVK